MYIMHVPPPLTVTHKAEQSQHSIQGTNNRKLGRALSVRLLVAYYAKRVEQVVPSLSLKGGGRGWGDSSLVAILWHLVLFRSFAISSAE